MLNDLDIYNRSLNKEILVELKKNIKKIILYLEKKCSKI